MALFIKAAEVWQPDTSGRHLVLSSAHYGDYHADPSSADTLEEFKSASQSMRFAIDEGLPGKTWAERRPLIWTNLESEHFQRSELADIAGLVCGLSIPVFAGEFLTGVVVLFCAAGDQMSGAVEVWQNRDYYDNELQLKDGYYGKLERFEWISRRLTIMRGRGLPGSAWAQSTPLIITNLPESSSFLRASNAADCGITTGMAIPFFCTKRDVQVVTFLSTLSTPVARRFEIWRPDTEHRYLLFSHGFCAEGTDLQTRFRGTAFARGEEGMGEVWLTGRPLVHASDPLNQERTVYIPFIIDGVLQAVISFVF